MRSPAQKDLIAKAGKERFSLSKVVKFFTRALDFLMNPKKAIKEMNKDKSDAAKVFSLRSDRLMGEAAVEESFKEKDDEVRINKTNKALERLSRDEYKGLTEDEKRDKINAKKFKLLELQTSQMDGAENDNPYRIGGGAGDHNKPLSQISATVRISDSEGYTLTADQREKLILDKRNARRDGLKEQMRGIRSKYGEKKASEFHKYSIVADNSGQGKSTNKIYISTTEKGLECRVYGVNKGNAFTIPWKDLGADFPKNSVQIEIEQQKYLPKLLNAIVTKYPQSFTTGLKTAVQDQIKYFDLKKQRDKLGADLFDEFKGEENSAPRNN